MSEGMFVPTPENPCPHCGHTGVTVSQRGATAGRRVNAEIPVSEMTLDQLTREIINASSCYCKAKARGAEELMEVSKARMDAAKAAKALLTKDEAAEKEARRAQLAAEKEAAKAAAKAKKDEEAAQRKADKEAAKVAAQVAKDKAVEDAKAIVAEVSTGTQVTIEEVGGL